MPEQNARVESAPKQTGALGGLLSVLVIGGMAWFFWGGGLEQQTASTMADINDQVASDAVAQYNIAKQSGSAMDACVHAGLVAASYLQAQKQAEYERWKKTETSDCKKAGLPQ